MRHENKELTVKDVIDSTYNTKMKAQAFLKTMNDFQTDVQLAERVSLGLCTYCMYIEKNIVGGQAITHTSCSICNSVLVFHSTIVDRLCLNCAIDNSLCKHCSSDLSNEFSDYITTIPEGKISNLKELLKGREHVSL